MKAVQQPSIARKILSGILLVMLLVSCPGTPPQASAQGAATPTATSEEGKSEPKQVKSSEPIPSQIIIKFKDKIRDNEKKAVVNGHGGTVVQRIDALNIMVVKLPNGKGPGSVNSPFVESVEQDYYIESLDEIIPNDPRYSEQWALPAIGAPEAWAQLPADAPQVMVAVVDSGICADHPDLAGRILDGWDFIESDAMPQDDFGHGCSVAGIIAANMNDGIGIAGVAPNTQIMPLRVLNASGSGSYSNVAAAIVYAADHGAQVINLSLGGSNPSSTLENAVNYAIEKGVTLVAAAGNNGTEGVLYPAAYPDVIAVGSVDPDLQHSGFSNYGPEVDIWAPGRNILTTTKDGGYGLVSGTSIAAPYVAGSVAINFHLNKDEIAYKGVLSLAISLISTEYIINTGSYEIPEEIISKIKQKLSDMETESGNATIFGVGYYEEHPHWSWINIVVANGTYYNVDQIGPMFLYFATIINGNWEVVSTGNKTEYTAALDLISRNELSESEIDLLNGYYLLDQKGSPYDLDALAGNLLFPWPSSQNNWTVGSLGFHSAGFTSLGAESGSLAIDLIPPTSVSNAMVIAMESGAIVNKLECAWNTVLIVRHDGYPDSKKFVYLHIQNGTSPGIGSIIQGGNLGTLRYPVMNGTCSGYSCEIDYNPNTGNLCSQSTARHLHLGFGTDTNIIINGRVVSTLSSGTSLSSSNGSGSGGNCGLTSIPSGYNHCADETGTCSFSGAASVIYGANNCYTSPRTFTNGVSCNNDTLGPDPVPGTQKKCYTNASSPPPSGQWRVEYFNDKNLGGKCHDDAYENSTYIFKNWGNGSPINGCNSDNFSVRFTKTVNFSGGYYSFHCQHDDGCRIFVDGNQVVNGWWDSSFSGHDGSANLTGNHEVKIEFYDSGGDARLEAFWSGQGYLPTGPSCTANEWCASYYGNKDLAGSAAIIISEGTGNINHDWGDGGVGYGFPNDGFSARWQRNIYFPAGRYRFHIQVDDGGRLYVNNQRVIDQWKDQGSTEYTVDLDLTSGSIPISFEYYDNGGGAVAKLWWETLQTYPTDDGYEENDSRGTAYDLSAKEQTWLSTIYGYGKQADEDWYRIDVTPNYNRVLVDLRFTHSQGDIDVALYDASGGFVSNSTGTADNEYIDTIVSASGGTYYIKVYYDDAGNQYDLWWDDIQPPSYSKSSPANGVAGQSLSPTLSWAASSGATSYEYCYSSAPGPCTGWVSVGNATSVNLSGLTHNYTYYWQVRAVNAAGTIESNGGTWWSFTTQTTATCSWPIYTTPVSASFSDVPMINLSYWNFVERLKNGGITAGCGSGKYCPSDGVSRASMAIFLLRGKYCGINYVPPAVGASTGFNDVPANAVIAPWVKQLAADRITAGCGNGNFCPSDIVSRASMAIFLLRAKHGGTYSPPGVGGSSGFNDVPANAVIAPWVKQLAAEGVTMGCGNGNYCPSDPVSRASMAIFLVRNFRLP